MMWSTFGTAKTVAIVAGANDLLSSVGGSATLSTAILSGLAAYLLVRLYMRNRLSMVSMVATIGLAFFLASRYLGVGV